MAGETDTSEVKATAGDKSASFLGGRPRWEDVCGAYPKNMSARSLLVTIGHLAYQNKDDVAALSAIRVSLALINAGMQDSFGNAKLKIINKRNPNYGSGFFADVRKLKDWLSDPKVWGPADVKIFHLNRTKNVAGILKKRYGVYLLLGGNAKEDRATLWNGKSRDVIDEKRCFGEGCTAYFWQLINSFDDLENNLERNVKNLNVLDGKMGAIWAAAKVMRPRANDNTEYVATICEINGKFSIRRETVLQGTAEQVMFVDCDRGGGMCAARVYCSGNPRVYIHTHGNSNKPELSATDLQVSFLKQRPVYLVNKDECLSGSTPRRRNELTMPTKLDKIAAGVEGNIDGFGYINLLAGKMDNIQLDVDNRHEAEELLHRYLRENAHKYPQSDSMGEKIPKE